MIRRLLGDEASNDATAGLSGHGWCANAGRPNRRWLMPYRPTEVHGTRVPVSVTGNFRNTKAATGLLSYERGFRTVWPEPQILGLAPHRNHVTQIASVGETSAPKLAESSQQHKVVVAKPAVRKQFRNEQQPMPTSMISGRPKRGSATSRKGQVLEGVLRHRRRQAEICEAHHLSFLRHRRELEEACQAYRAALKRRFQGEAEEALSIGELTEEVEALEKEVFDEVREVGSLDQVYRWP